MGDIFFPYNSINCFLCLLKLDLARFYYYSSVASFSTCGISIWGSKPFKITAVRTRVLETGKPCCRNKKRPSRVLSGSDCQDWSRTTAVIPHWQSVDLQARSAHVLWAGNSSISPVSPEIPAVHQRHKLIIDQILMRLMFTVTCLLLKARIR